MYGNAIGRAKFLEGTQYAERAADLAEFLGVKAAAIPAMTKAALKRISNPGLCEEMACTSLYASRDFLVARAFEDGQDEPKIRAVIRFLKTIQPGVAVLDYGCGAGYYAMYLAKIGCQVTVVEIEGALTDWLKWWFAKHQVAVTIRAVKSIAEVPEFEEKIYDVLLLVSVLEHVPAPMTMVQKLVPSLKKGGQIFARLMMTPGTGHLPESIAAMPQTKTLLESYADLNATVMLIGKGR